MHAILDSRWWRPRWREGKEVSVTGSSGKFYFGQNNNNKQKLLVGSTIWIRVTVLGKVLFYSFLCMPFLRLMAQSYGHIATTGICVLIAQHTSWWSQLVTRHSAPLSHCHMWCCCGCTPDTWEKKSRYWQVGAVDCQEMDGTRRGGTFPEWAWK